MQIREIILTELYTAYEILQHEKEEISYKEFEDLVYEMKKENYKIITLIDDNRATTYAGIKIETNLKYKKHLHIYELISIKDKKNLQYTMEMLSYLIDFAKMNLCKNILFSFNESDSELNLSIIKNGFQKAESLYIKEVK
ncbi:GNAT family N-acetyltransferase [Sulfurimonas sp. HSL-1716]|uniref:GNAT family N-acetyltransferase n=1 Tax=Hydrocurvibacter sulfurireducens TaxID=3131937 RepID=UPI0031F8F8E7